MLMLMLKKNSFLETKYPMPSQSENYILFQTKMVKIYSLFQTKIIQKPHLLGPHTPMKPILGSTLWREGLIHCRAPQVKHHQWSFLHYQTLLIVNKCTLDFQLRMNQMLSVSCSHMVMVLMCQAQPRGECSRGTCTFA